MTPMKGARTVLYTHCLVTLACVGLAVVGLERAGGGSWRFNRQVEWLPPFAGVQLVYLLLMLSCFAFPLAAAYKSVGRMSAWRWGPVTLADLFLTVVQLLALMLAYPVRE
jgi:hypothetical protein